MKLIAFIRHGQSEADSGGRTHDPAEIRLSDAGIAQARSVADAFSCSPGLIVTSPFLRARQTAQPLAEKYPNTPFEEWPVQEFTYLAPDSCRNSTRAERAGRVEDYWAVASPTYCDGLGAESFDAFIARARDCIDLLAHSAAHSAVVFSHHHFIAALMWLSSNPSGPHGGMKAFRVFVESMPIENCRIMAATLDSAGHLHF